MNEYTKKQVSVVIDMAFLRNFLDVLDQMKISGYTAVPAIAGSGEGGPWKKDKLPTEAGSMAMIYIVIDQDGLEELLEAISPVIKDNIGIITVTDVTVFRDKKF